MPRSNNLGRLIIDRFGPEKKLVPVWESPARRRWLDFLDSCGILSRPALSITGAIAVGVLVTAGLEMADDGPPAPHHHAEAEPILLADVSKR